MCLLSPRQSTENLTSCKAGKHRFNFSLSMTTQAEAGAGKSFVSARLPWIVAALAAVFYLLTLNTWVSPKGLQTLARAMGQSWFSESVLPVFTLVTSPFHWLPKPWIPAALNVFSAVCAVMVLGLLARCVALLPQDRTYKQREREQSPFGLLSLRTAWIPLVLAAFVCGLQLTFWENATNSSSDVFDLVLFAYSVRCLLEYRITQQESWLLRAAVVYAAGATDTWVMIALAPAFLVAMVWIRGLGFFQLNFLARLFLCGLAGLLFFLYLPLAHLRTDGTFWLPLKGVIGAEWRSVMSVRYLPHQIQFLLALTSLLPILVIGIRWKSHFGDSSQLGTLLTTWIFHLTHAVLLGVCIWAAFDPGFSLRDAGEKDWFLHSNRDRLLPLYFLGALSIGYLSGYFLLVFRPLSQRAYRSGTTLATTMAKVLNGCALAILCALLILIPAGLLYKNLPQIKTTNGPVWRQYAAALTANLPTHAILLSDRADTLMLAEAWLARDGKASDYVFLVSSWMKFPEYHRFQRAKHPQIWPAWTTSLRDDVPLVDSDVIAALMRLAEKNPIYYLNPSFGVYFEVFYPVPHGLVYEMKRYPANNEISPPQLPEAIFSENETFWKTNEAIFANLLPFVNPPAPGTPITFRRRLMDRMHIPFEKNQTAEELGAIYSPALNTLGVYDQRIGRFDAAAKHFTQARELSPDNIVAAANLDFNKQLRAGERIVADSPQSFEERFGKFSGWQQTLANNGLFDTATGCLAQGIVFAHGRLSRQSTQQFERVLSLAPDNQLGQLWAARSYVGLQMPEKAFPLIQELRSRADSWTEMSIIPADILRIELAADYIGRKTNDISPLLGDVSDTNGLDAAIQTCLGFRDYTNTLFLVERKLRTNPDDVPSLMTEGFVQSSLGDFQQAIPPLTHAISLQPTNSLARYFRAANYLQSGALDDALHDCEILEKANPKAAAIYYLLAEIYSRKKDTNKAIYYYQLSRTNMPPNSPQAKQLADRVKSLQAGSP